MAVEQHSTPALFFTSSRRGFLSRIPAAALATTLVIPEAEACGGTEISRLHEEFREAVADLKAHDETYDEIYERYSEPERLPFRLGYDVGLSEALLDDTGTKRALFIAISEENLERLREIIAYEEPDRRLYFYNAKQQKRAQEILDYVTGWHAEEQRRLDASGLTAYYERHDRLEERVSEVLGKVLALPATSFRDLALQFDIVRSEHLRDEHHGLSDRLIDMTGIERISRPHRPSRAAT